MESAIKQYTLCSIVPYRGGYRARTRIEYADGNTQIKEFTGKSRMTVTQRMQDYLQPLHIPQETTDPRLTENFIEALEAFFRTYRMPSLKRGSQDRIECTIRCQITPAFGGLTVQQVDADAIQQLLNRMAKDGYRFSTIKKAYLVLRPFFEHLVKTGAMSRSPLDSVRLTDPSKQKREQCSVSKLDMLRPLDEDEIGRAFTEEELAAFLAALGKAYPNGTPFFRQAAAFRLILNTGLRTGELLALRNYHIDLSRRRLLVRDNLTLVRKRENGVATSGCEMVIGSPKNGQNRYVPLNDEAIRCVQELRRERYFGEHTPLVCDKDGGYISPYAEYIATREGVEKIDESKRNVPATNKQKQLIKKILSDFPDSRSSLEYEDYLKGKTVGAASEFITRTLEENADEMLHTKNYADYIATRPRAERFGSHGLFTDDGVAVDLQKVSNELNAHTGNVWTAIVSLRREDAERLGFDTGARWRDMLRSQTQALSENLRIPMSNLRWFAAFHNESHHPHIHLIAYSTDPSEGYLSEKGVMALRSSFAKDIFAQDLLCEYKKQTEHRDALKVQSREVLAEIMARVRGGTYGNPQVEELLQALAKRLAVTNGKKQYGYLRKDIKEIIDNIVDELGKDGRIAALYNLWYEAKESALKVYAEESPERVPLSQNKEFKSVKNLVIAEAMKLNLPTDAIEEPEPTEPEYEPTFEEIEGADIPQEDSAPPNKWQLYRMAKEHLDRDGNCYDPRKAVEYLTRSAKQGYTVAKYMLGKLYLKGEDVPKQRLHALHWLESAVQDDNQYAEYLLGKTFLKGEDIERDTERAESLLRRSSEQGNKYAAYTLGKAYLDGDILAQSIDEAVRLLTESAEKNFAPAQFILGRLLYKGEVIQKNIVAALKYLDRAAAQKNPYAAYLAGKIYLTEESVKDIQKAVRSFELAAENGNDYAEYQLGKIYLCGNGVPKDYDTAMYYLHLAADHGNNYAAQLLHSIRVNGNWTAALASLRLLGHTARIIQNRLEDERRSRQGSINRKLRRKIEEKKQAQGLKQ